MITFYYRETNVSFSNKNIKDMCDIFEFNHLIKHSTCFRNSNPSYIGNFYTNKKKTFLTRKFFN